MWNLTGYTSSKDGSAFLFVQGELMTKDEALQMCLEYIETNAHERRCVRWAIKDALAEPDERNFCPRCGKRTADLATIHTCTPPQENT